MGRRRVPTNILVARNGKLYDKQAARAEAEPKAKLNLRPIMPAGFSKPEQAAWKYLADTLDNYGLLSAANAIHMEMLARHICMYRKYAAIVSEAGPCIDTESSQKLHPAFIAMRQIGADINRDLASIGLGSLGLAKVGSLVVKAHQEKNDLEALLD